MSKFEELGEKICKFVSFCLEQLDIKETNYELIFISSKEEWKKLAHERTSLLKSLKPLLEKSQIAKIEYGRVNYESSDALAMLFDIKHSLESDTETLTLIIKVGCPFIFQFVEKYKDKDCLVFLNIPLMFEERNRDPAFRLEWIIFLAIGHELGHYSDNLRGIHKTCKQLQKLALNLVLAFYKSEKLKEIKKKLEELLKKGIVA